jgi:hypothetical protein
VRSTLYSLFLQGIYFSDGGTVLCGGNSTGQINIRSDQDLNPFIWPRETSTVLLDEAVLSNARTIADGLESMYTAEQSYRRLKRGFHSYLDGMSGKHEETRMRHFVRSIEAFIRPKIGLRVTLYIVANSLLAAHLLRPTCCEICTSFEAVRSI